MDPENPSDNRPKGSIFPGIVISVGGLLFAWFLQIVLIGLFVCYTGPLFAATGLTEGTNSILGFCILVPLLTLPPSVCLVFLAD